MMGMTYTLRKYSDILLKVERIGNMTMSVPVLVVMVRAIYTTIRITDCYVHSSSQH